MSEPVVTTDVQHAARNAALRGRMQRLLDDAYTAGHDDGRAEAADELFKTAANLMAFKAANPRAVAVWNAAALIVDTEATS